MTKFEYNIMFYDKDGFEGHIKIVEMETQEQVIGQIASLGAMLKGIEARQRGPRQNQAAPGGQVGQTVAPAAPAAPVRICQKDASHGPMKFVQAGVSRAGKPYSAFYACDTCRGR